MASNTIGTLDRTRTCHLPGRNRSLFPLSYKGIGAQPPRPSTDLRTEHGSRDRSCTCILRVMSPTTYCLSTLHGASRETRTRNNCLEGSCVAITPVTHLVRSTGLEPVISGVRSRCLVRFGQDRMEPTPGLEPGTSFLPRMCTTRCARKALVGTLGIEPSQPKATVLQTVPRP